MFLLSYIGCIVEWNLIEDVLVSFLPIGHTHKDVDQAFSATYEVLGSIEAVKL